MPRLETERLVLRPVDRKRDLGPLFELFADPAVALETDTGPFTSIDEAEELIDWIEGILASRQGLRWVAAGRNDDMLIGTCGFNIWNRHNNSAEIGYDLLSAHWGVGLGTEAVRRVVQFGFEEMDLNRIQADTQLDNTRSGRVLTKLGFREEGVMRQAGFWRDEYHDLRLYSLLRQEWQP